MLFVLKQNCVWLYLQRLELGKIIKLIYLNFLDWIIGNIPVWKKKATSFLEIAWSKRIYLLTLSEFETLTKKV